MLYKVMDERVRNFAERGGGTVSVSCVCIPVFKRLQNTLIVE
jgi:hypothetical protein